MQSLRAGRQNHQSFRPVLLCLLTPFLLPALTQVLNDTYRSLSSAATAGIKPIAALSLHAPPDIFDINVTPDKRKVFMQVGEQSAWDSWVRAVKCGTAFSALPKCEREHAFCVQ